MTNEDDLPRSGRLARLSLRALAEYARREELIDNLDELGDHVVITQADNRFVLPKHQASTFLIGMLRGRSWFVDEPEEPPRPAPQAAKAGPTSWGSQEDARRTLDQMLDSLLRFATETNIIEGYEKHESDRLVNIHISAVSTELSYADALNFLLDCIQYEFRKLAAGT